MLALYDTFYRLTISHPNFFLEFKTLSSKLHIT